MTLCEKLTQARKAAGLTQADIAAKLHVSRQAVSRWESGQSKPSTEKLLALGALYGVSIDQLLNAEESVVEAVSDEPEAVPVEPVIPPNTPFTNMVEICGCCTLRRTADAGNYPELKNAQFVRKIHRCKKAQRYGSGSCWERPEKRRRIRFHMGLKTG